MNKRIILIAASFGFTAVVLGAFGAHALEDKISKTHMETWETAVHYQFYHTLALLFLATFSRAKNSFIKLAYVSFTIGIILFSGSLYLLSIRSLAGFGSLAFLGPVTPIGGLCFLIGWLGLFTATLKNK